MERGRDQIQQRPVTSRNLGRGRFRGRIRARGRGRGRGRGSRAGIDLEAIP